MEICVSLLPLPFASTLDLGVKKFFMLPFFFLLFSARSTSAIVEFDGDKSGRVLSHTICTDMIHANDDDDDGYLAKREN